MAIKRLKPKWNSTNPSGTAAPPASAGEVGEFLINRETGSAYIKKNDNTMQDVGPVKSVNGETGAVVISSDDIGTDGAVWSSSFALTGNTLKNARVVVVDSLTDISVSLSDGSPAVPMYSQILICQRRAGRVILSGVGGTTIISQGGLLSSGGEGTMCSLVKVAASTWMLGGALS